MLSYENYNLLKRERLEQIISKTEKSFLSKMIKNNQKMTKNDQK